MTPHGAPLALPIILCCRRRSYAGTFRLKAAYPQPAHAPVICIRTPQGHPADRLLLQHRIAALKAAAGIGREKRTLNFPAKQMESVETDAS